MLRIINKRTGTQLQINEGEHFHFDKYSNINDDMVVQEKDQKTKKWKNIDKIEYDVKINGKNNKIKIKKTGEKADNDLDRLVDGIQELIDQFKKFDQIKDNNKKNTYTYIYTKKEDTNEKEKCYPITEFKKKSNICTNKEKTNDDLLSKWKQIAVTSESDEEKNREYYNTKYFFEKEQDSDGTSSSNNNNDNENNQSDDSNDYFL